LSAVGVINNLVYLVGSYGATSPNVLSFDLANDKWTSLAPVGENLYAASAGVIGNILDVVGGAQFGSAAASGQVLAYAP
jgi:hypothetical protein